eukprot:c7308_g1_i1.p1 GENE.c7308_g1_i1~~c7308_g1_i1.p1  ORF type:complete len:125 (-),score=31.75 c7308_g1_i1:10-384(-)
MFEKRTLKSWGHQSMIRLVFLLLSKHGRQKGVQIILDTLQHFQGASFHFTLTYFWIQMVHICVATVSRSRSLNSFADFSSAAETATVLNDSNYYLQFYSVNVIDSPAAATQMVLPDKKPLPSIL